MEDTIELCGQTYERVPGEEEHCPYLVVLDRGLTMFGIGQPSGPPMDGWWTLNSARCVIRWGTIGNNGTGHLAELATNGPSKDTKLGSMRAVTIRADNIVAYYKCKPDIDWNPKPDE